MIWIQMILRNLPVAKKQLHDQLKIKSSICREIIPKKNLKVQSTEEQTVRE